MLVLGIDTASNSSSVALFHSEKGLISEINLNVNLNHSDTLMTAIDKLFSFSNYELKDLKKIGVSKGPGSFTGIRVGLATAKALAFSLNIPLVGVNELDILANNISYTDFKIISLIDARKERVYYSVYKYENKENLIQIENYNDGNLKEVLLNYINDNIIFTGNGIIEYRDIIDEIMKENAYFSKKSSCFSSAAILCDLVIDKEENELYNLEAFYLSKSQAERNKK